MPTRTGSNSGGWGRAAVFLVFIAVWFFARLLGHSGPGRGTPPAITPLPPSIGTLSNGNGWIYGSPGFPTPAPLAPGAPGFPTSPAAATATFRSLAQWCGPTAAAA